MLKNITGSPVSSVLGIVASLTILGVTALLTGHGDISHDVLTILAGVVAGSGLAHHD